MKSQEDSQGTAVPITTTPWESKSMVSGAVLIVRINLNFLETLCQQIVNNLDITIKSFQSLIQSKVITQFKTDRGFPRRIGYLALKIETSYSDILKIINNNEVCKDIALSEIEDKYAKLQSELTLVWEEIKTSDQNTNTLITQSFIGQRPDLQLAKPTVSIFLGVGIALVTGTLAGGLISTLFSGTDHTNDIANINDNLHKVNSKVLLTNKRIDILSENVAKSLKDMQVILSNMVSLNKGQEERQMIVWNLGQLKHAGISTVLMLKITDNTLTLLKAGYINSELLDLKSFKEVINEGENYFPNLQFPVRNLTRRGLNDIQSLIEVKSVGINHFIMVIPLTYKQNFDIFRLVPLPIRLQPKELMIASLKEDIMLFDGKKYMLTTEDALSKIQDQYILKKNVPVWDITESSCQLEAFRKNTTEVIRLCQFRRLGISHDLYLTDTKSHRIIYTETERTITVDCPSGRIRQQITGLHVVPNQCDISTTGVNWPAKVEKTVELSTMLDQADKSSTFDITSLPIFEVNDTNSLHETIKTQIENLPTNDSLTFTFKDFDLSTEEVQVYSTFAYILLFVVILINSILIGILFFKHWRNNHLNDAESGIGIGTNISRGLFPRDSLNNLRTSLRTKIQNIKSKWSNQSSRRSSIRSSIKSAQSRARRRSRSIGRKIRNASIRGRRSKSPTTRKNTVEASTNTRELYPSLSSINNTPKTDRESEKFREPEKFRLRAYR